MTSLFLKKNKFCKKLILIAFRFRVKIDFFDKIIFLKEKIDFFNKNMKQTRPYSHGAEPKAHHEGGLGQNPQKNKEETTKKKRKKKQQTEKKRKKGNT